jgi:hypothetical protein
MCNRIQGRTPVFLTWTFGISYDTSDVVSEVVHLCSHGLTLSVIELGLRIHQTLVSEVGLGTEASPSASDDVVKTENLDWIFLLDVSLL